MGYVAVPVDQEIKREFGFSVLLSNSWPSLTKLTTGFAFTRSFPVLHWLRPSYTGNKIKNQSVICIEDVPLVEFMYLVFTRMPGESYLRRLRSFFVVVLVLRISSVN